MSLDVLLPSKIRYDHVYGFSFEFASLTQLFSVRNELFYKVATLGLTKDGDELVSRRDSCKNPLNKKLTMSCIKNESPVPHLKMVNIAKSLDTKVPPQAVVQSR